jgi:hypothetical protein
MTQILDEDDPSAKGAGGQGKGKGQRKGKGKGKGKRKRKRRPRNLSALTDGLRTQKILPHEKGFSRTFDDW